MKRFFYMYQVYIIYSKTLDVYYKGFTTDLNKRILEHTTGLSRFTSKATDWELVYSISFETKKEALLEEKRLKKLNRLSIKKLLMD
ncbi:GIY-YIG nuclease family protein [Flavobacterium sp.]